MSKINRRGFFQKSTLGLGTYSLVVHAEECFAQVKAPNVRSQKFKSIAPGPDHGESISESNMTLVDLKCDLLVAGGGLAGICAAISAARNGAKVILLQDRSRLGGNSSSEVRMHVVGADNHGARPGWRESGLIEEFRLEDAVHNPHRAWELWDLMLYDKCICEENITLLLDTALYSAFVRDGRIQNVLARCDKTEHIYRIESYFYADCTGDSRLALEAGAEFRVGRESRVEFSESLAPEIADRRTQGSSILFTSRKHDRPIPFIPPSWARKIRKDQLEFRPVNSWEYGYWWIELGGMYDTIKDNEQLRFELLAVVLGVWDYIKNSGNHPDSENWALETVGMIPGKRESRRVTGEVIQTQQMLEGGWKTRNDGVAIGGWNLDDHPPEGFDAPEKKPFTSIPLAEPYNISLGALISKSIPNLLMAGRNISNTHVAFSSTRVMATCGSTGQSVGTAAAFCLGYGVSPKELLGDLRLIKQLQQRLLRDDQSIRLLKNEDSQDHALTAKITASSHLEDGIPENVINGKTRDFEGSVSNKWVAELPSSDKPERIPWLELEWDEPQPVDWIQLTFDTGFQRELTLSAANHVNQRVIRGPQPETICDYRVLIRKVDGTEILVADIRGNYQRMRRHMFKLAIVKSVRIEVLRTNGMNRAHIFEVRCYGDYRK
jgi:hypothetical protein